jgi:hypothetical protein
MSLADTECMMKLPMYPVTANTKGAADNSPNFVSAVMRAVRKATPDALLHDQAYTAMTQAIALGGSARAVAVTLVTVA